MRTAGGEKETGDNMSEGHLGDLAVGCACPLSSSQSLQCAMLSGMHFLWGRCEDTWTLASRVGMRKPPEFPQ